MSVVTETQLALKEWAVTIDYLARGEQIVLLRKGGIREERRRFEVQGERFFLYPTFDHQRPDLLKEEYRPTLEAIGFQSPTETVHITHAAQITDALVTTRSETVDALQPYYIWTTDYAMERLKWKRRQPLHILLLRVHALEEPMSVTVDESYLGCRSWIDLKEPILQRSSTPVLDDEVYEKQRRAILDVIQFTEEQGEKSS